MAGGIDLFSGSRALTGVDLWQNDKNPLNELFEGVEDVIGEEANAVGQAFVNFIGEVMQELGAAIVGGLESVLADAIPGLKDIEKFFDGVIGFLGGINPLDLEFDIQIAAENFVNNILAETGLLPILDGAGHLIQANLQPLIDAISVGFGGATGLGFSTLQSFLVTIPGAQGVIDKIYDTLTITSGTGHTLLQLGTALANYPASFINGVLNVLNIPNLDASIITSGAFAQAQLQALIDAVSVGFGGATGLGFSALQTFLGTIPGAQGVIDKIYDTLTGTGGTGHTLLQLGTALAAFPASFVTGVLNTLNIPNLDASIITSGAFAQAQLQSLINAVSVGFGGTTGIGFSSLQSFLAGLPTTQGIIDKVYDTLTGTGGTGHTLLQLGTALAAFPASFVTGVLNTVNIPNLDASIITSGAFAQAQLQGLINAVSAGFGGSSGLSFSSLQTFLATIPAPQSIIDNINASVGVAAGGVASSLATSLTKIPGVNVQGVLQAETMAADIQTMLSGIGTGVTVGAEASIYTMQQALQGMAAMLGFNANITGAVPGSTAALNATNNEFLTQASQNKDPFGAIEQSGDAVFPISQVLGQNPLPTVAVTQATRYIGFIKTPDISAIKESVGWQGSTTGSLSGFYLTLHQMNVSNSLAYPKTLANPNSLPFPTQPQNELIPIYQTPNINGLLQPGWNFYTMANGGGPIVQPDGFPTPVSTITTSQGNIYAVEVQVVGTGTYNMLGINNLIPPHTGALPQQFGAQRISTPPAFDALGTGLSNSLTTPVAFDAVGVGADSHGITATNAQFESVSVGANVTGQVTATTNIAWTHAASAASYVVAQVAVYSSAASAAATVTCTCNGIPMTQLGSAKFNGTNAGSIVMFGLAVATAGLKNIAASATVASGAVNAMAGQTTSYLNVASAGTPSTTTGSGASLVTTAVTNVTGGVVVCGLAGVSAGTAATWGTPTGASRRNSHNAAAGSGTGADVALLVGDSSSAGSVSMSDTVSVSLSAGGLAVVLSPATTSSASILWAHTPVATGAGVVVSAVASVNSTTAVVTMSATYGGVPMQMMTSAQPGNTGDGLLAQFFLPNAPSGTQSVVVTATTSVVGGGWGLTGNSVSYSNANAVFTTGSTTGASATSLSETVNILPNQLAAQAFGVQQTTGTPTVSAYSQTSRYSHNAAVTSDGPFIMGDSTTVGTSTAFTATLSVASNYAGCTLVLTSAPAVAWDASAAGAYGTVNPVAFDAVGGGANFSITPVTFDAVGSGGHNFGAPAFDAIGAGLTSTTSSSTFNGSWSHTAAAGSAVIVWVMVGASTITSASVTYGGAAMSLINTRSDSNNDTIKAFVATNVPGGPQTVALTSALTSASVLKTANSVSYVNCAGVSGSVLNSNTGTALTTGAVTSSTTGLVATCFLGMPTTTYSFSGFSGTSRAGSTISGSGVFMPYVFGDAPGAASVTTTATGSVSHPWAAFAIQLAAPTSSMSTRWTHTATAGAYVVASVGFGGNGSSPAVTPTAFYGNTAMTLLGTQIQYTAAGYGTVALFGLANAPAGATTVVANGAGTPPTAMVGNTTSYLNVATVGAVSGLGSNSNPMGVQALTGLDGAVGVFVIGTNNGTGATYGSPTLGTLRYSNTPAAATDEGLFIGDVTDPNPIAGTTVLITQSPTTNTWGALIVILNPVAPLSKTISWSHTAAAGSYLTAYVAVSDGVSSSTFTASCTYNGVAMELIGTAPLYSTVYGALYIFGLANAPGGSHTVSATVVSTTYIMAVAGSSTSYLNVGVPYTFTAGAGSQLNTSYSQAGTGVASGIVVNALAGVNASNMLVASALGTGINLTSYTGGTQRSLHNAANRYDIALLVGDNNSTVGSITFAATGSNSGSIGGLSLVLPPSTSTTISWTHTATAGSYVFVKISGYQTANVDPTTVVVTYGGQQMLEASFANQGSVLSGFTGIFYLGNVVGGAQTVAVTATSDALNGPIWSLAGSSDSYVNVGGITGGLTATGTGTALSHTVTTPPGGLIVQSFGSTNASGADTLSGYNQYQRAIKNGAAANQTAMISGETFNPGSTVFSATSSVSTGWGSAAVTITPNPAPASLTWNHTLAANANLLLVWVELWTPGATLTVTCNGMAMTLSTNVTTGNSNNLDLYYLQAPPTGKVSIVVKSNVAASLTANSTSYIGVSSMGTVQSLGSQTSATSMSQSLTGLTANQQLVAHGFVNGGTGTFGNMNNGTTRWINNATGLNSDSIIVADAVPTTATMTDIVVQSAASVWASIAVPLNGGLPCYQTTFDTISSGTGMMASYTSAAYPSTWTHTISPSATNSNAIFVWVFMQASAQLSSGAPTCNGVPMVDLFGITPNNGGGGNGTMYCFGLSGTTVPSGSYTISMANVVTTTGSSSIYAVSESYLNVEGFGTAASAASVGTSPGATVAAGPGQMVAMGVLMGSTTATTQMQASNGNVRLIAPTTAWFALSDMMGVNSFTGFMQVNTSYSWGGIGIPMIPVPMSTPLTSINYTNNTIWAALYGGALETQYTPDLTAFSSPGAYDYTIPSWANHIDIIVFGAGGGGGAGNFFTYGNGGAAGGSQATTIDAVAWTGFTTLSVIVASGGGGGTGPGVNGGGGGTSQVSLPSGGVLASAGGGGGGFSAAGGLVGASAGNVIYGPGPTAGEEIYYGGGGAGSWQSGGGTPGGGGAGGNVYPNAYYGGGPGGNGTVYFLAYQ